MAQALSWSATAARPLVAVTQKNVRVGAQRAVELAGLPGKICSMDAQELPHSAPWEGRDMGPRSDQAQHLPKLSSRSPG